MDLFHQIHQATHPAPNHLLSVHGLSIDYITNLMRRAEQLKDLVKRDGGDKSLHNKILALYFSEPSTRTSCSFQAAMQRLGGTVINVNNTDSSIQKGESLEDTIRTLSSYCDAIVIRHALQGSAAIAAEASAKPVINAGDTTPSIHISKANLILYLLTCRVYNIHFS